MRVRYIPTFVNASNPQLRLLAEFPRRHGEHERGGYLSCFSSTPD